MASGQKTQGEKAQEFKNSRGKTQVQAQKSIFRHNWTKNINEFNELKIIKTQDFARFYH